MRRLSWPSRHQPEEGFTLVEVLVAMVLISTALLVLAATMFNAFASIGFSRQRDTATQLANQAMEQIKALNFSDLAMSVTDLTTPADPLVTCTSGAAPCTFKGRTIPTVSTGSPPAPLFPHTTTIKPAPAVSTYTISSYLTFDPSNNKQALVATVRVTWDKAVQGTGSTAAGALGAVVQIESTIFATGPLAVGNGGGNGGHVWNAQAQSNPGTISVSGTLLGTSLANVQFGPGSATATIAADGTASATGAVGASVLQLVAAGPLLNNPGTSASATSPPGNPVSSTPTPQNDTGLLGTQSASLVQGLNLVGASLGINFAASGGVGPTATVKALAANSASAASNNFSGQTLPGSSLPYAQGFAQQSGLVSLNLNLGLTVLGITTNLLSLPLINLTPLGNYAPDLATVCQQLNSGAGCAGAMPGTANIASGVSQALPAGPAIVAQAQKTFSQISVLPTVGLLNLTGFTTAASAAAGPGTSANGSAASTGTLSVLGAGLPFSSLLGGLTRAAPSITVGALGLLNVSVTASTGAATTGAHTASVSAPLNLTVTVSLAGLVNLTITVNLGSVNAGASYS